MKIRCLVVDDEPLAIQLISEYISRVPDLELVGKCKRATEVPPFLSKAKVDLMFLDIRMPDLTGLQLLKSLQYKPVVILITAYSEHALEGFDLDVADYLLKPVPFERFVQAVNKARRLCAEAAPVVTESPPSIKVTGEIMEQGKEYFFVKSGYKSYRINFSDILYIEGLKEYVSIFTKDRRVIKLASLKHLEETLPGHQFIRIHKSYIVSKDKVTAVFGNTIEINEISLPVGRLYKEDVMRIFS